MRMTYSLQKYGGNRGYFLTIPSLLVEIFNWKPKETKFKVAEADKDYILLVRVKDNSK